MTDQTAAHVRALELFQSGEPRALNVYLELWRRGIEKHNTDFVLSVIAAYGRLAENNHLPDIVLGDLTIRVSEQRVRWQGKDPDLTITEYRITKLLVEKVMTFITYRSIYDEVHYCGFAAGSGIDGYRTNVRSMIKRMRRKFEAIDASFNEIETYPGFGYRWRRPPGLIEPVKPPVVEPVITTPQGTPLPVSPSSGPEHPDFIIF